jgi:hypothetical protein
MPGIEGSYSMVSMEMRRQDCVLRFLPGRVLLKGVAQRLRHGRQCYVTRSSRDIYCRNHVSIYGCKDSWVRTMKCGIARVDNSGAVDRQLFPGCSKIAGKGNGDGTTNTANNGRLRCRIWVFPAKSQQGKIMR